MSVIENQKTYTTENIDIDQTLDTERTVNTLEPLEIEEFTEEDFSFKHSMELEQYLQESGYVIPRLMVERTSSLKPHHVGDFQLPASKDIYKESSYEEFRGILARLQPGDETDDVRFQLDFKTIWRGLTGKTW